MKRKVIIVCSIILVVALCIGTSYFFVFKDKDNKESKKIQSNNNEINQLIQEKLETSIENIKESNDKTSNSKKNESDKKESISNNQSTVVDKQESNNNTVTKKENNVVKEDNTNKNETVKENKEEQIKNNSTDETNNNESVDQEESTPEVKEEIEESNPEVEVEKQEPVPEVDEEYERLKQLYKYPTSQACYEASIETSLKVKQEDSNYRNAGCISGAYKGELVGYRIIIYYNDGTTKFYD